MIQTIIKEQTISQAHMEHNKRPAVFEESHQPKVVMIKNKEELSINVLSQRNLSK